MHQKYDTMKNRMFNGVVEFIASFLIYLLFLGLFVLWVIDGKIKKEQVVHALFSVFVTLIICTIIKHFFPTIRPYLVNGQIPNVFIPPLDPAFPSMHTAVAFALSVTVYRHDKYVGVWFLFLALLIGVARVVADVHYPVDIVGGMFIGSVVAIVVDKTHFLDFVNFISTRSRKK